MVVEFEIFKLRLSNIQVTDQEQKVKMRYKLVSPLYVTLGSLVLLSVTEAATKGMREL